MRQDPTEATNPSASSDDLIVDSPFSVKWTHRVRFTSEAFDPGNPALLEAICAGEQNSSERGMIVLVDQGVSESHPSIVGDLEQYCAANTGLPELRDVMQLPGESNASRMTRSYNEFSMRSTRTTSVASRQ